MTQSWGRESLANQDGNSTGAIYTRFMYKDKSGRKRLTENRGLLKTRSDLTSSHQGIYLTISEK